MRIVYTHHARHRMTEPERGVTEDEVEVVLSDPDVRRPGRMGAQIADKTVGNRRISVVYREEGPDTVVITVVVL